MIRPPKDLLAAPSLKLPIKPGRYKTKNGRVAVITRVESFMGWGYLEPRGKAKQRSCQWFTKDGTYTGGVTIRSHVTWWDLVERLAR